MSRSTGLGPGPGTVRLVQFLGRLDKPYVSVADLEKILGLKRESLYVALGRMVKSGVLERLRRGIYRVALRPADSARTANLLYLPSYLSFESALARYHILGQIPYMLSFATTRRSKRMTVGTAVAEFRQLRRDLFFGYVLEGGLCLAEPEKALLDELYLIKRGKAALELSELRLVDLSREKLWAYAARFPSYVQDALHALALDTSGRGGGTSEPRRT